MGALSAYSDEWNLEKSFGPDGSSLTGFSSATSVAVDEEDELVYVLDRKADALFKFDLNGNPVDFGGSSPNLSGNELSGLAIADFFGPRQIAVDPASHTIYVPNKEAPSSEQGGTVLEAFHANGEPAIFSAGAGAGTNEIPGFEGLRGVSVDSNGNIYTSEYSSSRFTVFKPSGAEMNPGHGVASPGGIAVDQRGVVHVLQITESLIGFTPSEYPVTPSTTYAFESEAWDNHSWAIAIEPSLNRLFAVQNYLEGVNQIGRVKIFEEDGSLADVFAGPGEEGELKNPQGIAVAERGKDAVSFVAEAPKEGLSQVKIFKEALVFAKPTVESEAVSSVTGDSATLQAKINPKNLDTVYWWEYGLEDCELGGCTKVPIDGVDIGNGKKGIAVSQIITGLQSQSVYHYRVVAENSEGRSNGSAKIFTTQGSGLGFALSDSRAWEMVSPPNKHSGTLFSSGESAVQASSSGDGLVYASQGSIVQDPVSSRLPEPASLLAKRNDSGEWTTRDLTPPHLLASRFRGSTEFKIFSPDLLRAEMEPADDTPLSPESSERTPYLWDDGSPPVFTPLVNPGNVPPGTEFGSPGLQNIPLRIEGANSDLSYVVIRSDEVPLVEDAEIKSVYVWHDGELEPVSQLPEGGAVVEGKLGSAVGSVRHAVSEDGSRVFWGPLKGTEGYSKGGIKFPALYLRDTVAKESIRLDGVKGGDGKGGATPAFNIASADGRVVFFTDSQHLTKGASPSGRDLYRCEIGQVSGKLGCAGLTDISAPLAGSGESAEVLDQVPAASEDGTRLYFVARGILDKTPNEEGDAAQPGGPNLYIWEEGQGVRFIASLADGDFPVWGGQPGLTTLGYAQYISSAASPSGRFFAFTSEESLTHYENRNEEGAPNTEVYLYDAEGNSDQLFCVSCNPSGAAAVGEHLPASAAVFPPDRMGIWANRWAAATLPEATHTEAEGRSLYRPRSVLDNGRVFFNSVDPLVPADSNGNWDVYQWQPLGVGSCIAQTSAAAAVRSGNGCVGLISSGSSEGDAGFMDATPSGNDVFFLTKGRLSVTDKDSELDAYDARVNGIEAVLSPPQECAGEACQPSVGPPRVPTPASETFRGAETPVHCRKGQRKIKRNGKTLCVKKHKKHKKHHKKRAGKNGGAQR